MIPAICPKRNSAPKKHILRGPVFSALFLQQIPDLGEQLHLF